MSIKIEYKRGCDGKYYKVTKQSKVIWNIVKREEVKRKEWVKFNPNDKH